MAILSLATLELFVGVNATAGALFAVPSLPEELLAGSPFTDYTIPALALGVLVGGGALVAAGLLFVQRQLAVVAALAVGLTIIIFELVESSVVGLDVWLYLVGLGPAMPMDRYGNLEGIPSPFGVPLPLWLQPFFSLVGLTMIVLALRLWPRSITSTGAPHSSRLPIVRPLRLAYVTTSIVAICLVISSAVGLLFGQRGLYELNPSTITAFLTQDVLSLVAAVPLLLGSMWKARHGSVPGLLLWMGTLFYVAYAYSYTVFGDRLAPLFLLYSAIISTSLYTLLFLLLSTNADAVKAHFSGRAPTSLAGGFVAFMALALGSAWAAAILSDVFSGTAPSRVQLVVWPMDLIVAFPALFWGGVYLWRRHPLGYVAGGIVLLKAAAEGLTLVLQSAATVLMGGPGDPLVPVYGVVGLGGLVLLVAFLRSADAGADADSGAQMAGPRLAVDENRQVPASQVAPGCRF